MEIEDKYTNKIEAYLGNLMSQKEREDFESSLKSNQELADAFRDYKLLQAAVENYREEELRQKFSTWKEEKENPFKRKNVIFGLIITAFIIFLIIMKFSPVSDAPSDSQINQPGEKDKPFIRDTTREIPIALRYYNPPKETEARMGSEEPAWFAASDEYNSGNFKIAIDSILSIIERNAEMTYYLAHSYFQIQDYQSAAELFENLSLGNSIYNRRSEWFYILAIQVQEQDISLNLLDNIAKDINHAFHQEAKQLQLELQKRE